MRSGGSREVGGVEESRSRGVEKSEESRSREVGSRRSRGVEKSGVGEVEESEESGSQRRSSDIKHSNGAETLQTL